MTRWVKVSEFGDGFLILSGYANDGSILPGTTIQCKEINDVVRIINDFFGRARDDDLSK